MSKAFVRDSDRDDDDPLDVDAQNSSITAYITPTGYRRLQQELTSLWHVERPKITEEVATAAAQGDRSENAEYIYGKKKLREIDRRIRYLTKRIDAVTVVASSPDQRGRVFFGARVTIEDEAGDVASYRIVGPDESDLNAGTISVNSPLAKALIGKREGDEARVVRPKGVALVTIVSISYEG